MNEAIINSTKTLMLKTKETVINGNVDLEGFKKAIEDINELIHGLDAIGLEEYNCFLKVLLNDYDFNREQRITIEYLIGLLADNFGLNKEEKEELTLEEIISEQEEYFAELEKYYEELSAKKGKTIKLV